MWRMNGSPALQVFMYCHMNSRTPRITWKADLSLATQCHIVNTQVTTLLFLTPSRATPVLWAKPLHLYPAAGQYVLVVPQLDFMRASQQTVSGRDGLHKVKGLKKFKAAHFECLWWWSCCWCRHRRHEVLWPGPSLPWDCCCPAGLLPCTSLGTTSRGLSGEQEYLNKTYKRHLLKNSASNSPAELQGLAVYLFT